MRNRGYGYYDVGGVMMTSVPVGTRIWFDGEKQGYTVQASNRFFSVCTKPFNAQKTVLYTVVDWFNRIRGTENLIFGMGAETREHCEDMLRRLTSADSDISHRNYTELLIIKVKTP